VHSPAYRACIDLPAIEAVERRLRAANLLPDRANVRIEHDDAHSCVHVAIEYRTSTHRFSVDATEPTVRSAVNDCVSLLARLVHGAVADGHARRT
jgi:hypothetical protein